MFFSNSSSTGSEWTSTVSFKDYCTNTSHPGMKEGELLDYFANLGTTEEEISEVRIFRYDLNSVLGAVGGWHEYVIVNSTNYYWSFEKDTTGLYVQRLNNEADVKDKRDGKDRPRPITLESRGSAKVTYKDKIYNIIEWIIKREELNNAYCLNGRNCQIFASLLYEAIAKLKGRELKNKK